MKNSGIVGEVAGEGRGFAKLLVLNWDADGGMASYHVGFG